MIGNLIDFVDILKCIFYGMLFFVIFGAIVAISVRYQPLVLCMPFALFMCYCAGKIISEFLPKK